MTQAKHTQGPWYAQDTLISTNEGRPHARVMIEHENYEANAALIAAAPETAAERDRLKAINAELLEALENMVGNVVADDHGYAFIKAAKAAIAKARGQ